MKPQPLLTRLLSAVSVLRGTSLPAAQHTRTPKTLTTAPSLPPLRVYQEIAANYANMATADKQALMWWLYKTNIATKSITRLVLGPVIGNDGFSLSFAEETPTLEAVVSRYFSFNKLTSRTEQRRHVRGYLNNGELCFLTAPYRDTWFTIYCPPQLIRHTLVDPLNPEEVIAVVLAAGTSEGTPFMYKTVTNEDRLSPAAMEIRSTIPHYCLYHANFEYEDVETVSLSLHEITLTAEMRTLGARYGFDPYVWLQTQRRGTPFFDTWLDLFNQLVEVLWAMLDKTKSWGAFNYHFQYETGESDVKKSMAKVAEWQAEIGTPDMNSAIYTDEKLKINPLTFPMQSNDIQKILDTMLQVTGLSGNVAPYDLGANLNSTFATANAQGSPQEQFEIAVQTDMEDMYLAHADFVLKNTVHPPRIPAAEWKAVADLPHFGVTVQSPEISKKDKGALAMACKVAVETLAVTLDQGLHTPASIAQAERTLIKEYLGVEIDALTEEQLAELRQQAQDAQAQKQQTPRADTAQEPDQDQAQEEDSA